MIANSTLGFAQTIYGDCSFFPIRGESFCRLHLSPDSVVAYDRGVVASRRGTHPAVAMAGKGGDQCCAERGVLVKDLQFLAAACTTSLEGFAYLRPKGLPGANRWGNGGAIGPAALGTGYCYVPLFRAGFRMRVARLLGPFPLVTELLTLLRLAGDWQVNLEIVACGFGVLHCRVGRRSVSVAELVAELLGYVALDPGYRIGGDGVEDVGVVSRNVVERADPFVKGPCHVCGFVVKLENHELRCRIPRSISHSEKLIGDAVHSLDVKRAVVAVFPEGAHYSVLAAAYVSNKSQRDWLETNRPGLVTDGMSDHSAGDLFEELYVSSLRDDYLDWLAKDLGVCRLPRHCLSFGACRDLPSIVSECRDREIRWFSRVMAAVVLAELVLVSFLVYGK